MLPGVYEAYKKDKTKYYRSSITYHGKHISLGSFSDEDAASSVYLAAGRILSDSTITLEHFSDYPIPFEKFVSLINFRDNNLYCRAPIYLRDKYFIYYLSIDEYLTFDVDDLFYYSRHKIQKRGGHLFVTEYGMQVNILNRYGIKNYAVAGRDYIFKNGIDGDFRYSNIEIINKYHGVSRQNVKGQFVYVARIHVNGDIIIGKYKTDYEAAIAYNKAVDILHSKGVTKNYPVNYIIEFDAIKYSGIYSKTRISSAIRNY